MPSSRAAASSSPARATETSSINEGATDGTDGTYIPAHTGVMLKTWDGQAKTPDDFHYTIGEKDINYYANPSALMFGVTEVPTKHIPETFKAYVKSKGETYKAYVMQGGVFRPVGPAGIDVPAHKAYLGIPTEYVPAGAKVSFGFEAPDEWDEPTAVEALFPDETQGEAAGELYDLSGRKVGTAAPKKGIYVRNGKKIIVK